MAKTQISWKLDLATGIHKCTHVDGEDQAFDMCELYPMWDDFTEVQKECAAYGHKQKSADATAASKDMTYTPEEKRAIFNDVWGRLTDAKNPTWNIKGIGRTSAVQKAVEKATKAQLKALHEVGLLTKEQYEEALTKK